MWLKNSGMSLYHGEWENARVFLHNTADMGGQNSAQNQRQRSGYSH